MCKNLMIAGLDPKKNDLAWKFIFAATPHISAYDKDGVGVATQGKDGIHVERWLNPKDAFTPSSRKPRTKRDVKIAGIFENVFDNRQSYNSQGKPNDFYAILLHTRMATCDIKIENTHPFLSDDGRTALIHNGVVRSSEVKNESSTCDSELILRSYARHYTSENPTTIDKVAKDISGSYACGVLTYTKEGKPVMDIFRNDTSTLVAVHVKELDALVYCTNADIITATCKHLKWTMGTVFRFNSNKLVRLDSVTGLPITDVSFKPAKVVYSNGYSGWKGYVDYGIVE